LRSDREHCASRVAVEQDEEDDEEDDEEEDDEEEEEDEDEEDEEDEEEATDIKSNNPHLAGGEKKSNHRSKTSNHMFNHINHINPEKTYQVKQS